MRSSCRQAGQACSLRPKIMDERKLKRLCADCAATNDADLSFCLPNGIICAMAWWQRPKIESPTVRIAQPTDRPMVADLLARAVRQYGAQAVEDQMALLNSSVSSVALAGDRA